MNLELSTMRLSVALMIVMTSLKSVYSASPLMRAATNQNAAFLGGGRALRMLSRRTRSIHGHMPCISLGQLTDIKARFEQWMDKDLDGRANFSEVRAFLKSVKPDVTDDRVSSFIARRDQNHNGQIELVPEYIQEMAGNDYGEEAAREWFYLQDINGDGFVSKKELVAMGVTLGVDPERAEQAAMGYYLPLDLDGDGRLNYSEFKQIYEPPQMPTV